MDRIIAISLLVNLNLICLAVDTINIRKLDNDINISDNIYIYEDEKRNLTINDIRTPEIKQKFVKNKKKKLNFGITRSGYWINFTIKNATDTTLVSIFNLSNPDLDEVDFYCYEGNTLIKKTETGELKGSRSREIFHRNYLFKTKIKPDSVQSYYIYTYNRGEAIFIPFTYQSETFFYKYDNRLLFIIGISYGLLLFILIFNLYLYKASVEKINLYYALYVLFACLFTLTLDGFLYMTNIIWLLKLFSIIKWSFPSLGIYYLLAFSQLFLKTSEKFPKLNNVFNILKITALICLILLFIPIYPINIVPEIVLNITLAGAFIINILASIISYNKDYLPSKFFLSAFAFMAFAAFVYLLRDLSILKEGLITDNSIRFGLLLETILLTIAVLERFRIQQENSKKTIQDSYEKIHDQKNELIKVNTELEKLSVVASETENSVAIYNINGFMEWCNAGFERLYDTTFEELVHEEKHNIRDIVNRKNIEPLINFSVENKQAVFFENMIKTKKKRQAWLQTTITPYISKESNQTKLIAIDSDISELKLYERNLTKAKEKAEESDRLKTSFLANMSHEIRTPLNGIIGFGDLLKKDYLPKEKRKRYLDIIDANGQHLLKLIDDILDISLIESNQLNTSIKEFNINQIMDETFEFFKLYKKNIQKDNIELNVIKYFLENSFLIESDPDRIRQVLSNLINNAFKFTEKGKISFGYILEHSYLEFFVEDSGTGINEAQKESLFKRFRQGEETLKRKHGGAGLGLSISKGIIELLGGKIWYDDNYKEGARFCFTLPVTKSNLKIKNVSQHSEIKKTNKTRHNKKS